MCIFYSAELDLSLDASLVLSDVSSSDVFAEQEGTTQTDVQTDTPVIKSLQADLDAAAQESV